jgi:hypothetical protein
MFHDQLSIEEKNKGKQEKALGQNHQSYTILGAKKIDIDSKYQHRTT